MGDDGDIEVRAQQIRTAVLEGNCTLVRSKLQKLEGSELQVLSLPDKETGRNALHLALIAKQNRKQVTRFVCCTAIKDTQYNVDQQDKEGRTPLMLACETGQDECLENILELKPSLVMTCHHGRSPIMYATLSPDCNAAINIITRLLDQHAVNGGDVNRLLTMIDDKDYTALHHAINMGRLAVVKLLVDRGADVNQASPLHLAVVAAADDPSSSERQDIVRYLLEQNADPFQENREGFSVVTIATGLKTLPLALKQEFVALADTRGNSGSTTLDNIDSPSPPSSPLLDGNGSSSEHIFYGLNVSHSTD